MRAKELIEENNHKRKLLNKENLKMYEDMLIYVRLSFSKSERETEEILSELLDHLLMAQEAGRSAKDVFGDDPKQFASEIVGELPKMVTKERMKLFFMGVLYFLASVALFNVIFNLVEYYAFSIGELRRTFHLGTVTLKTIVSIPVAFLLLYLIVFYLRWECFRGINRVLAFFIYWLYGIVSVGVFILVIWLLPDFGPVLHVPFYGVLLMGIVLGAAGWIVQKWKLAPEGQG